MVQGKDFPDPKVHRYIYEVAFSDTNSIVGVRYSEQPDGTGLSYARVATVKKWIADGEYSFSTRIKTDDGYVEGAPVEVSLRTKRTGTTADNLDELPAYTPTEAEADPDPSHLFDSLFK